jgi:hypothetical protein
MNALPFKESKSEELILALLVIGSLVRLPPCLSSAVCVVELAKAECLLVWVSTLSFRIPVQLLS